MNKYQEALEVIENVAYKQYEDVCYNKTSKAKAMLYEQQLKDVVKILKPIINKETPTKPIIDEFKHSYCPRCNTPLVAYRHLNNVYFNRCNNEECGQRIDWDNTQYTAL